MSKLDIEQITKSLWHGRQGRAWTDKERAQAVGEFIWCCNKSGDDELGVLELGVNEEFHLEAVGHPSLMGDTPLHLAMKSDNWFACELLIKAGGLLEAQGRDGNAPLGRASGLGAEALMHVLLAAGANPNALGFKGYTPLMRACIKGHLNAAKMLVGAGADLDAVNADGVSVRTYAARSCGILSRWMECECARREKIVLKDSVKKDTPVQSPKHARKMSL